MDNRGVGRSSMPRSKKAYTSETMAIDVLCIMVSRRANVTQPSCREDVSKYKSLRTVLTAMDYSVDAPQVAEGRACPH